MAVIPEVFNRESILFKKLRALGFPPSPTVGALSTGMTTFYEFINDISIKIYLPLNALMLPILRFP